MSDRDRSRAVPSGRLARLAGFGQLAGGIMGGALAEGARRLAKGERPHLSDMLLTPANAVRTAERLSALRGAAMKLGQMLSMDAGDLLPRELTAILAQLRDAATIMPPTQLNKVLTGHWGANWRQRFRQFDATPIAAASIGQVHRAILPDGQVVAVKVQYPGIADSIDADIDNVATLLRLSGLPPPGVDVAPLLAAAKVQLREEADYCREAAQMMRYKSLLAGDPAFVVPTPNLSLSGERVLVMDFVQGKPIQLLADAPQDERDRAMSALMGLVLRELFAFGVMQTDPNFANYRWQPDTGRIVLLDFGAVRDIPADTVAAYRALMQAGLREDRAALKDALLVAGFVSPAAVVRHGAALDAIIQTLLGHIGRPGLFDFADRSFVERVRGQAQSIIIDRSVWHAPPAHTLFVQRKVSGSALLAVHMAARVPLREMVAAQLGAQPQETGGAPPGSGDPQHVDPSPG